MRMNVEEALEKQFRPEFLNRLDEFIVFDSLTQDDIKKIVDKFMGEVAGRVADLKVTISLTEEAKEWLARTGFDRMYGARPLKRAIQRHVESPLSKRLIAGEYPEGSVVVIDAVDGELTFSPGDPDNIGEVDASAREPEEPEVPEVTKSGESEKESIAR